MGNTNTKESRSGDAGGSSSHRHHRTSLAPAFDPSATSNDRPSSSHRTRNRASRNDLGTLLGIGATSSSSSRPDPSYERRETKQEREARRLERERIQRVKERERSIREEHVDGGYLVTMGVYVGAEDYSKQVVRQLQIERKLAPFWRGLNDFDDQWAEHQIIAAARGLPIPPAGQTPPDELIPRPLSSSASPSTSTQNLNNLTVPIGPRTQSAASDRSASNVGSALPSPTGPGIKSSASPFKPRTKALAAALSLGSRNGSSAELAPREINLPNDPFVNGQPLEVFLYKEGSECPICFLYYPPYLNHTRCCDQAICSECFVQIKRPDPHFPEGHGDGEQAEPSPNPEEQSGLLISEPAQCPYCQQTEFGVTYDPPPFRRGLTYAISPSGLGTMSTAMSSSSSLNSGLSPTPMISPPPSGAGGARRRTQSLSANAPNVITTDRVRPDWAAKLAAQRNHQARRAAAATALHTAAFLMGDSGSRPFSRMSRFSRRNTNNESNNATDNNAGAAASASTPSGPEPGPRNSSGRGLLAGPTNDRRQSHMENLENMMLAEAIRLSLAAEEDRKRKAEKEEKKDAKRREKEERKAAKAAAKGHPYSGSGQSSTNGTNAIASTGSSSGATNVASVAEAGDKGKGVDRGPAQTSPETEIGKANVDALHPDKAPTSTPAPPPTSAPRPVPSPHQHAGPSHLRQMSNASSGSSQPDSQPGSYQNQPYLQEDPHASGVSLAGKSDVSDEGGAGRSGEHEHDDTASTEPMFNYRSLAQMVGVEMDGINAGRRLSQIGESHAEDDASAAVPAEVHSDVKRDSIHEASAEHAEDVSPARNTEDDENDKMSKSVATLTQDMMNAGHNGAQDADDAEAAQSSGPVNTPHLMVTPETPLPDDDEGAESKQLGFQGTRTVEIPGEMTH
ncbi:C2H2 zinc finger protein [Diaporthe amygdali]|uniref:C2H2 zinc finger protein n=1 Tax=Phomopsis amygdali TaxID=1214568 RepID=UPI0022FDB816|nr:C2H2 zinc finger protein [Diaporthe amygdali]KAJ0119528.1 C2H2 zinc finger protein [Diaporthe amygdali]